MAIKTLSALCNVGLLFALLAPSVVLGRAPKAKPADQAPAIPAAKPGEQAPGVTVQKDMEYVPGGGASRSLDLYLPPFKGQAVPLLIFIHGGGWHSGSKDGCPAQFLAEHGYAVASLNYRFIKEAASPAQLEDCRAALRFLRSQAAKYHLQPDHVGVWGGSAGRHLAALLGTAAAADFSTMPAKVRDKIDESVRVQCVIDMYGPADFNLARKETTKFKLVGPSANEEELLMKIRSASPITYVRRDNPPFLLQHGDADQTVPLEQSRAFSEALQKAGVEVTLMVMPGAGHADAAFFTKENHQTVLAFLDKHLRNGGTHSTQPGAPKIAPDRSLPKTNYWK